MIEQIIEYFFSKVGEKLVDTVGEITNFKSTLENLKRNLNSLSAKADDVKKEIRIVEQSGKKKRKREVENWLEQVKIIESECRALANEVSMEGFIRQFLGGDGAKEMNARICELVEQSRHFGELALDDDSSRGEAFLTSRLVGEAFGENLERIWTFLVTDKVSSIGIHGMGGVGKSTLARHINNQLLERSHECVLWVTISQEYSIMMLQDKIAGALLLDLSDEYDEDKRAVRLNRALSQRKNFVLILDDVWRSIDLEKAGVPHFVDGCQLIITTRSLEVCRQIGCQETVAVKPLNADEGWNLFSEKLGQTKLAPQVEKIAMSVAKVCNGLPLGIITIAGSLRGETDIRVWRNALTELQKSAMENDEMEDQVFKVLKYSFDRLDPNHRSQGKMLQLCFLYCSLYPEDYEIRRGELVRKFISEELVDKRKSIKAQLDEGHWVLNRLVNVSLLESASDNEEGDSVKMHDLVRAMALKITEGKTMVIAGQYFLPKIPNEKEWTMDLEKISLMDIGIEEIPHGMSPNCPKLSTLLLRNNDLELIPESFFSRMCGLCILDLSGNYSIKELPNFLSELESLKALLLGGCHELEYVPYLGKLKALKELDLSGTAIREVPKGMEKLVNLKYLSMIGARHLQMLPTGLLLNLPCLQLLHLPYQMQAQLQIERLKQLEEFKGRVKDMSDFNRFIIESRPGEQHIVSYCIWVGKYWNYEVASRFLTYKRINKLSVHKYDLKKEKDVIVLAESIQHLKFSECKGLSNCLLDALSDPKSLEKLVISNCRGIECILRYEQLMAPQELESGFQALEVIDLRGLDDFMGVIHKREIGAALSASPALEPPPPYQAVFSSLRRLSILHCNKMKKLGLPVSEFPNLEILCAARCDEIEEIIEGEAALVCLPKLKELMLEYLPRLRSICSSMHKREIGAAVVASPPQPVFSSLGRLYISQCNKMKKLGLPISVFQKFESIEIESCEEIEEIIEIADDDDTIRSGEGEATLVISLPKLRYFRLCKLPRLKSICKVTMNCSSIEIIILQGCRELKKLPLYFPSSTTTAAAVPQYSYSSPPALESITLLKSEKEWWDSLEWEHPTHNHLLQPFLQFHYF